MVHGGASWRFSSTIFRRRWQEWHLIRIIINACAHARSLYSLAGVGVGAGAGGSRAHAHMQCMKKTAISAICATSQREKIQSADQELPAAALEPPSCSFIAKKNLQPPARLRQPVVMGPNTDANLRQILSQLLGQASQMAGDPALDKARMEVTQASENLSDAITKLPASGTGSGSPG